MSKKQETIQNCPTELLRKKKRIEIKNSNAKGDWTQLKKELVNQKSDAKKLAKCRFKI